MEQMKATLATGIYATSFKVDCSNVKMEWIDATLSRRRFAPIFTEKWSKVKEKC